MNENAKDLNADEFMRGQRDCQEGEPCPADASDSYKRGFATEYQHQENMTAISEVQNGLSSSNYR